MRVGHLTLTLVGIESPAMQRMALIKAFYVVNVEDAYKCKRPVSVPGITVVVRGVKVILA